MPERIAGVLLEGSLFNSLVDRLERIGARSPGSVRSGQFSRCVSLGIRAFFAWPGALIEPDVQPWRVVGVRLDNDIEVTVAVEIADSRFMAVGTARERHADPVNRPRPSP